MTNDAPPMNARKARTRAALIAGAQSFLAKGTTNVSIQELTDAAGVGFGSFYNHFSTKEELFAAATQATLQVWSELRDEAVAGLDDPAEIFARSFRMTGRLQRRHPEVVRIVLNAGMSVLVTDEGLRPRAVDDLARGIEQGRFTMPDVDMALAAAGAALLGMLQFLETHPDADDAAAADLFAERTLVMLGLDASEARDVATRGLPPMPTLD